MDCGEWPDCKFKTSRGFNLREEFFPDVINFRSTSGWHSYFYAA